MPKALSRIRVRLFDEAETNNQSKQDDGCIQCVGAALPLSNIV